MWLLLIIGDGPLGVVQLLIMLAIAVYGAISGSTSFRGRHTMLEDEQLLDGLNAEQRLRLEINLQGSATPRPSSSALDSLSTLVAGQIAPWTGVGPDPVRLRAQDLLAESRAREAARRDQPAPEELAAMRLRTDAVLRAKWERLCDQLDALAADHSGAGWTGLLESDSGLYALHADLSAEIRAAQRQPTYPPLTLQLSGTLETIGQVLKHAGESCAEATSLGTAAALREMVLKFVARDLAGIKANIATTRPDMSTLPAEPTQAMDELPSKMLS